MLGAALCFVLGRQVIQGWVREKVSRNGPVARLCAMMGAQTLSRRDTFTIVVVSRLPPVMPFALTNYALAITDCSFSTYFVGSFVGVSPACVLEAYIGSLCDDLAEVFGLDGDAAESYGLDADAGNSLAADMQRYEPHEKARMGSARTLQLVVSRSTWLRWLI
jgi:hypothetical protein